MLLYYSLSCACSSLRFIFLVILARFQDHNNVKQLIENVIFLSDYVQALCDWWLCLVHDQNTFHFHVYTVGYDWKVLRFDSAVTIAFSWTLFKVFFNNLHDYNRAWGPQAYQVWWLWGHHRCQKKKVLLCSCHMSFKHCIVKKNKKHIHCVTGMYSVEIIKNLFSVSISECLSFKHYCSSCFHVREVFKTAQLSFLLSFIYTTILVPVTMASFSFQSQLSVEFFLF